MAHRVAIVALPGTFVLDLAVAAQAFGRRPSDFSKIREETESPYDVRVCGAVSLGTSLGFAMSELGPLSELEHADTVVVPGLEGPTVRQEPELLAALAAAAARGARMVSLCAGAFVLGQAGVLAGRRVTTHWALADEFRSEFPDAELLERALYVDDGSVLSSGGMLAAADLCLHILRLDHGQAYANDIARILISPPHRVGGQAQYVTSPRPATGTLSAVMAWVLDHLADPLSLDGVAAQAHMSPRTLERRFRAETGESLHEWISRQRVDRARALLEESDLTVTEIAYRSGFGSTQAMRRTSSPRPGPVRAITAPPSALLRRSRHSPDRHLVERRCVRVPQRGRRHHRSSTGVSRRPRPPRALPRAGRGSAPRPVHVARRRPQPRRPRRRRPARARASGPPGRCPGPGSR